MNPYSDLIKEQAAQEALDKANAAENNQTVVQPQSVEPKDEVNPSLENIAEEMLQEVATASEKQEEVTQTEEPVKTEVLVQSEADGEDKPIITPPDDPFIELDTETSGQPTVADKTNPKTGEVEGIEVHNLYRTNPRQVDVPETNVRFLDKKVIPPLKEKQVLTGNDDNDDDVIHTLRGTVQSVLAALERMDQIDQNYLEENRDNYSKWVDLIQTARNNFMLRNDQLFEATVRKGSIWMQMLNHGTEDVPQYRGLINDRKGVNPGRDKGDTRGAAMATLLNILKLGASSFVPLYHTGIWLKLRTPSAADFIRLDEAIMNEKATYGLLTRGAVFNNDSVIARKHIADFILDLVEWSTAPSDDKDYLKSIIKTTDLDSMMLGVMQARYPDGYPLVQVCTVDPAHCTHVVQGDVDLRSLNWVDTVRLTEKQYRMLVSPAKKLTEEQIKEYQEEFKTFHKGQIILTRDEFKGADEDDVRTGVILNIETPTLQQEEDYGVQWIYDMMEADEEAFREKSSPEERRLRIEQKVSASFFKTYGQWVESIDIREDGVSKRKATEQDEIDDIFTMLSGNASYTRTFVKGINKHVVNSLVSMVGIVNYECPNCGKKHDTAEGNHHIILPIDMLSTFFILFRSSVKASFLQTSI